MNHCYELLKKMITADDDNLKRQDQSISEFQDDLETIDRSIKNFTMNYQQTMSMLESKHMQNQENLTLELEQLKQHFMEQRYLIQGDYNISKKNHEETIFKHQTKGNEKVRQQAYDNYDKQIIELTLEKSKLLQSYEEKKFDFINDKEKLIALIKDDIESLNNKKEKDLRALVKTGERVEPVDTKNLSGEELEDAKVKRRIYHKEKSEEIDRIFNIQKYYAEKIIEKEALISKTQAEMKMRPQIWLIETKIQETEVEHKIKQIENQKTDYLEKEEIMLQYLEKKERDSILFEEEDTIESLKESKINEEFSEQDILYRKKVDRNLEIIDAAKYMHEFHLETIESSHMFLDTLISSTHMLIKDMLLHEAKRLHMQVELLVDMLNQYMIYLTTMITKETEALTKDFSTNVTYLDFDAKLYSSKYHIVKSTLIKENLEIIQELKKQIGVANDSMQKVLKQLEKQVDFMKTKSVLVKSKFYQGMKQIKLDHHNVLLLFRRNYMYKLEEQFALQKAIKLKEDAKPIKAKMRIHQVKEKLFDEQNQALQEELNHVEKRTKHMESQILTALSKTLETLNKELSKQQKLMQDLIDGIDVMVERKKNIVLIQLQEQKKIDISKI